RPVPGQGRGPGPVRLADAEYRPAVLAGFPAPHPAGAAGDDLGQPDGQPPRGDPLRHLRAPRAARPPPPQPPRPSPPAPPLPELALRKTPRIAVAGRLTAGGAGGIPFVVSGGVTGELAASIAVSPHDPGNHQLRWKDVRDLITSGHPLSLFDISGQVTGRLFA